MVELAKKYRLAAVFTLPAFSAHVAERLQDTREIHAGGVVSFPGGNLILYANYVADSGIQGISKDTVLGHHGVGIFWNIQDWTMTE